jgi:hypothetical protein
VRQELVVAQRFRADEWVDDVNGHVRIFEHPAVENRSPEVDNPNPVGFAGGLDRSFPNTNPVSLCRQFEVWEDTPDCGVLLTDA